MPSLNHRRWVGPHWELPRSNQGSSLPGNNHDKRQWVSNSSVSNEGPANLTRNKRILSHVIQGRRERGLSSCGSNYGLTPLHENIQIFAKIFAKIGKSSNYSPQSPENPICPKILLREVHINIPWYPYYLPIINNVCMVDLLATMRNNKVEAFYSSPKSASNRNSMP